MIAQGSSEGFQSLKEKEAPFSLGAGFYAEGDDWYWLSSKGDIRVPSKLLPAEISFELSCAQAEYYDHFPFEVRVFVGQELARRVTFQTSKQTRALDFQLQNSAADVEIRIESEGSFIPSLRGINADVRRLSVCLSNLRLDPPQGLRDCPLCLDKSGAAKQLLGSLENTSLYANRLGPKRYELVLCSQCDLIYLSPLPPQAVFEYLYISSNQFNNATYMGRRKWIARFYYWRRLEALLRRMNVRGKPIRVLEIGGGLSWMCRAAKNINAQSTTVAQDISPEAAELCKWVDHYFVGELTSKLAEIQEYSPYQIISLTHVIEHLPDPIAVLQVCGQLLDKTGLIFITAPHRPKGWKVSSPFTLWKNWSYNHVPAHLQYFNETSIKRGAEKSNLKLVYLDVSPEKGQALEAWLSPA